jgi:hypothetical protein
MNSRPKMKLWVAKKEPARAASGSSSQSGSSPMMGMSRAAPAAIARLRTARSPVRSETRSTMRLSRCPPRASPAMNAQTMSEKA